jgi:DNA-binding transcriptional ArsR family regulator
MRRKLISRAKVLELHRAGLSAKQIARKLGVTYSAVHKHLSAAGVSRHQHGPQRKPVDEQRVVELFRQGFGGYTIAKMLHAPANQVFEMRKKYGIPYSKDGRGNPQPKGDIAGFLKDLERRAGYIAPLAKKHGLGICKANQLAHEYLGCIEFRPGASTPPLSSNFPMKEFDPRLAGDHDMLALVSRITDVCFDGRLPIEMPDDLFVSGIMLGLSYSALKDQPQVILDNFRERLARQVKVLRRSQVN